MPLPLLTSKNPGRGQQSKENRDSEWSSQRGWGLGHHSATEISISESLVVLSKWICKESDWSQNQPVQDQLGNMNMGMKRFSLDSISCSYYFKMALWSFIRSHFAIKNFVNFKVLFPWKQAFSILFKSNRSLTRLAKCSHCGMWSITVTLFSLISEWVDLWKSYWYVCDSMYLNLKILECQIMFYYLQSLGHYFSIFCIFQFFFIGSYLLKGTAIFIKTHFCSELICLLLEY